YCASNAAAAEQLANHQRFLEQLRDHADRAAFKRTLASVATAYHESAAQEETETGREPIVVTLWNRIKINAGAAASVAIVGVFSTLWLSGCYQTIEKASSNYSALRRDMNNVKKNVNAQNAVIRNINSEKKGNDSESHFGATGFAVSPNGYVITNYHVVKDADSVHLQNTKGESFKANVIYIDPIHDL